jgi:hypothetical protein
VKRQKKAKGGEDEGERKKIRPTFPGAVFPIYVCYLAEPIYRQQTDMVTPAWAVYLPLNDIFNGTAGGSEKEGLE